MHARGAGSADVGARLTRILGTGAALPRRAIPTRALVAEAFPERDADPLCARIGIDVRYWLSDGESAATLAQAALVSALENAGIAPTALRRLILTTSTGGDHLIPSTAHTVANAVGMSDVSDAFDVNNSCVGFLTALDLASLSIGAGRGPVAIVAVETFSRHLHPRFPRPWLVLGDAAAAVILDEGHDGSALLASVHHREPTLRGRLVTPHPGATGAPEHITFEPSAAEMTDTALRGMSSTVARALDDAGLRLEDIAWFLPHQPNGDMLGAVTRHFGVPAERLVPVVREVGSIGSASIPTSLHTLWRSGRIAPGGHLLLTGIGSGTAAAAAILRVGAPC